MPADWKLQPKSAGCEGVRRDRYSVPNGDPAAINTLTALGEAEARCTRCPLYRNAIQVVPGEGPRKSPIMLVGEQPGDREDREGKPFVGPAGKLLDRALEDAGLDRDEIFMTNAVKHFKYLNRGKRRLHKRPNAGEIVQCRWWLDIERRIVKPRLTVALGGTAAYSLFGRAVTISKMRGCVHEMEDGRAVAVTVHPSALLRVRDANDRAERYGAFVADLKRCAAYVNSRSSARDCSAQ
jgi:DNA polymerase